MELKLRIEEKKFVMLIYFITLTALMLAINDKMILTGLINKLKYVYIVVMLFFNFYDATFIWSKRCAFGVSLLLLHTILFGLIFKNVSVLDMVNTHFQQLIVYFMMSIVTLFYVIKKDCLYTFIKTSYWSLISVFSFAAVTHLSHFVNPIYFVNIFSRYERFRAEFGFGDVNYCGNYALYALMLAFFLYVENREGNVTLSCWEKRGMVAASLLVLCVLFSTASRSAILSMLLVITIYIILKKWDWIIQHGKLIFICGGGLALICIAALAASGTLSQIWLDSNREGNFSINYPIFQQYGNYLYGMGYIDNSGFLNMAYGFQTTAMDVYYLYIPFSSGIVGSILIFGQMIHMLICLLKYKYVPGRNIILSIFCAMLFYAVWQVNYMNYRYYTGIIHFVFLFYFVCKTEKKRNVIQLKRK